ncbi:MAG: VWA domain-containing protein [Fidelibacterota bacterium]
MFRFANPYFLFILLSIPILLYWHFKRGTRNFGVLNFSSISIFKRISSGKNLFLLHIPYFFRVLALGFLILAFSRPQSGIKNREVTTEGIDIMLVLDISSSMLAEDFRPNRLEAVKSVALDFIDQRVSDRIGLVVFASESFIQCPLTIDYEILKKLLNSVTVIEKRYDGTAIGMAIANSINRLRSSESKSKIMILLSDGRNNAGELDPITAAQLAKINNIKIYTIGAGGNQPAPFPVEDPIIGKRYIRRKIDIDEETLKKIAEITAGKYFRATDESKLAYIYREINAMEKTEIKVKEYTRYSELFPYFLIPGLILMVGEMFLSHLLIRRIP